MAYTTLKVHRKRLLKMPRDHLREFLQETLKKAWALDDDVFIKQLQASKHELGKLHCLLPPQAKPDECCSLCLGLPRVSLERVPPPKTPRCSSMAPGTAQEQLEGITAHPEGPHLPECSSLHMILKSSPEEEAGNSVGGNTKCQGPGSCGVMSKCVGAPGISPGPKDAWKGKLLSSWASTSRLSVPAKGVGCPPPELGSQQGLAAPSTPALVRMVPSLIHSPADQAVGLKTSHLQSIPGTLPRHGDRPSLKPAGVIAVPGPQPWVPSPASRILAIRFLGQLQLSRLLQEWAHSLPGFSMLASMLHRAPFRGFCSLSLRGVTLGQLMR
ncbi:uncharacterized protein LOC131481683 [Ochotona princeps]|uniref:uncharacterized protein LOC131481683 n=1 Tax=Ochotona princeps TaxID=9978 RepID=UPI0027151C03|nr:uncharacterized protein LOC131481683 [Ochotona princeps]